MKLIIKSLLVLIFKTFFGCNNKLDKSVIEPMEIEDLKNIIEKDTLFEYTYKAIQKIREDVLTDDVQKAKWRSEEHTSEVQSRPHLVCRLLLEKKKKKKKKNII